MDNGFYVNYTASWYKSAIWLLWATALASEAQRKGKEKLQLEFIYKFWFKNLLRFTCKKERKVIFTTNFFNLHVNIDLE